MNYRISWKNWLMSQLSQIDGTAPGLANVLLSSLRVFLSGNVQENELLLLWREEVWKHVYSRFRLPAFAFWPTPDKNGADRSGACCAARSSCAPYMDARVENDVRREEATLQNFL